MSSPVTIVSITFCWTSFVICAISERLYSKPVMSMSSTSFPSFQMMWPAYRFFLPAWKNRR